MIDSISFYEVVDSATILDDNPYKLCFTTFDNLDDANTWMWKHAEGLQQAVENGQVEGVSVKEIKIPAQFVVVGAASARSRQAVPDYLGFGAKVVAETTHFYIVGVPTEHVTWQCARLGSGLHFTSTPFSTLDAALREAVVLEQRLYDEPVTV